MSRFPMSDIIIIYTTLGNSSLTRDMMRDVFPTLAVEEGREKMRESHETESLVDVSIDFSYLLTNSLQFIIIL